MQFFVSPNNVAWLAAVALSTACGPFAPDLPEDNEILDGPIDGLTRTQMRLFITGDEEFSRNFSFSEGVGPIFNATSCTSCHPGDGRGHPEFGFQRFGRQSAGGGFDPLLDLGGPQLQDRSAPGFRAEVLPVEATGVARFMAPSITGLGLVEALDDDTLLALSDPDDSDGDGISGRVHRVPLSEVQATMSGLTDDGRGSRFQTSRGFLIGRFGRKGSNPTLLSQAVSAYHQDMGLTSDFALRDPENPLTGSLGADPVVDPEISSDILFAVTFYLRTLRPPARRNAGDPTVMRGERIFSDIGCAGCHTPTLASGVSDVEALSEREFHPYSDFLLHDLGPQLDDGYAEGDATRAEWRTTPLWGLGLSAEFQGGAMFLLHDGRASSFDAAVGYHGGEASVARDAFEALDARSHDELLAFLRSL